MSVGRLLPLALLLACAAPPSPAVEVIVRGVIPARFDFSDPAPPFLITIPGAHFCSMPKLAIGSTALTRQVGPPGDLVTVTEESFFGGLFQDLVVQGRCGESLPVKVRVDCSGQAPMEEGLAYANPVGETTWDVGMFGVAKTVLHAATMPTSRAAGIRFEVAGEFDEALLKASIDTGGVAADIVQDEEFSNREGYPGWFAVRPRGWLGAGQTWTVRVKAGLASLHTKTRCLDFDGERAVTITARNEGLATFRFRVLQEDPVVVEADEMGAAKYQLEARTTGRYRSVVATASSPRIEWPGRDASVRTCLAVSMPDMPLPNVTEETCLEPR